MSTSFAGINTIDALVTKIKTDLAGKVNKVSGYGLSQNNYTGDEKNKLMGIEEGANKTVIVDNLTSTDAESALSAKQGKVLDGKISTVNTALANKGDMFKSTYDTDGDGVVDDAAKLGGQAPSYYAKAADLPSKVSDLTNDSGFQTATQVNDTINAKISSAYKAAGSVAFASLPTADAAHQGMVYNISDAFTTTASFVDGAGKSFPAGTNVVVVADGSGYKYDVLAGFVDLSSYVASADLTEISAEEVRRIWNLTIINTHD